MKNSFAPLLTLMIIPMMASSSPAQSRCASVLRSFTNEQVNLTLEDLARMTLAFNIAKAEGNQNKTLSRELEHKAQETRDALSLSHEDLRRELVPRIARLQDRFLKERKEEQRVREASRLNPKTPNWIVKETKDSPEMTEGLVGISDVINGSRKVLYVDHHPTDMNYKVIKGFDIKTGVVQVITNEISTHAIDGARNRLLTHTTKTDKTGKIAQVLQFYSLKTLFPDGPKIELKWPEDIQTMVDNVPRALTLAEDGNSFAITSNNGIFIGKINQPDSLFYVKSMSVGQSLFMNPNEILIVDNYENKLKIYDTRKLAFSPPTFKSESQWRTEQVIAVNDSTVALFTYGEIIFVDIRNMTATEGIQINQNNNFTAIPGFTERFVVSLELGNPRLRNVSDTTNLVTDFKFNWPRDMNASKVTVSADGKALVIGGTDMLTRKPFIKLYEQANP
jgi:Phage shock protein A (IM30), suppresses sigma54-dependent transcription